jgi:hypothetical protein
MVSFGIMDENALQTLKYTMGARDGGTQIYNILRLSVLIYIQIQISAVMTDEPASAGYDFA